MKALIAGRYIGFMCGLLDGENAHTLRVASTQVHETISEHLGMCLGGAVSCVSSARHCLGRTLSALRAATLVLVMILRYTHS